MTSSNPTLIFCPGAWYPPTAFEPLAAHFPDHTTHTVAFPSIQQATSVQDLQPDINTLRALVEQEASAGKDVVIISHSWSGLPVNSALDGLSKTERQAAGETGGVAKLVFISAFIPDIGESLIGAFGGVPPDWYDRDVSHLFIFYLPSRYPLLTPVAGNQWYRQRRRPLQPLLSRRPRR